MGLPFFQGHPLAIYQLHAKARRGLQSRLAGMYAQMLVGMVALTGQWWLDARSPGRREVAAHLVNLAWNGLSGLEARPTLRS